MSKYQGFCICKPGDPCDYHLATCIVCPRPCKGHPYLERSRIKLEDSMSETMTEINHDFDSDED